MRLLPGASGYYSPAGVAPSSSSSHPDFSFSQIISYESWSLFNWFHWISDRPEARLLVIEQIHPVGAERLTCSFNLASRILFTITKGFLKLRKLGKVAFLDFHRLVPDLVLTKHSDESRVLPYWTQFGTMTEAPPSAESGVQPKGPSIWKKIAEKFGINIPTVLLMVKYVVIACHLCRQHGNQS